MDYDELSFHGLKQLSIQEVKSWLDKAETFKDLEINADAIKEFAGLFYPTANRIHFQFGGEYNDSGYDLSICDIQGAIYHADSNTTEYLPPFDVYNNYNTYNDTDGNGRYCPVNSYSTYSNGRYCPVTCAKSLKELGYEKLSRFILENRHRHDMIGSAPDDIYSDFKYSMIQFNGREVNSEFKTDYVVFNLETGEMEGFPQIPEIYGRGKDFPDNN